MKNILLLVFFVSIITSLSSQVITEQRIEFELKDGYRDENVFPAGPEGFVMYKRSEKAENDEFEYRFEFYNENMQFNSSAQTMINKQFYLEETIATDSMIWLLLKSKKEYIILVADIADKAITIQKGSLPKNLKITEMVIMGDQVLCKGIIKKQITLLGVNWKTGVQRTIPVNIDGLKELRLEHLQVLSKEKEIFAFIKFIKSRKESETYTMFLNEEGEPITAFNFSANLDKNIISITGTKVGNKKYVYTGTYSARSSVSSQGIFFAESDQDQLTYIKFYDFLQLNNFLTYLPQKRQDKIKKKQEKKEEKGKEYNLDILIVNHDIIVLDDGYIFLGEAYYPTYRAETRTSYVNGVMTMSTYYVFDGYQYTHAVIAKFNKTGEMEWDQCFAMWPSYKPYTVKKFISVTPTSNSSIDMVFASYNRIVSKSFSYTGEVLKDKQSDELKTDFEGDRSRYTSSSLDYWYENYFIAYGMQMIVNKENKDVSQKKRKVYFINKISY